jgi:hypothetical protein
MKYTLDTTAEKLVHALCEAILLKARLAIAPDHPESVILRDLLEDLAGALALYAGLPEDGPPGRYTAVKFTYDVHRCADTWHVARVFTKCLELQRWGIHPYFSITDMHKLDAWRAANTQSPEAAASTKG